MRSNVFKRLAPRALRIALLLLLFSVSASAQSWRGVSLTPQTDTAGNLRFNAGSGGVFNLYPTIQKNATSQKQRPKLNFGKGFKVNDNSGNTSTDIKPDTGVLSTRYDLDSTFNANSAGIGYGLNYDSVTHILSVDPGVIEDKIDSAGASYMPSNLSSSTTIALNGNPLIFTSISATPPLQIDALGQLTFGAFAYIGTSYAGNHTLLATDPTYFEAAVAVNQTINLPDASTVEPGRVFIIKRTGATHTLTIHPFASQTIDGSTSNISMPNQWDWIALAANLSMNGWNIIARNIATSTTASLTANNSGSGASSGAIFDGSAAKTISYNTIGAQAALTGTGFVKSASGTISYDNSSYTPTSTTVAGFALSSNITLAYHVAGYGLSGSNYAGSASQTWIADTTVLKSKAGFLTDYNNLSSRITTNTSNISTNTSNIALKVNIADTSGWAYMHLAKNETITGTKTFSKGVVINLSSASVATTFGAETARQTIATDGSDIVDETDVFGTSHALDEVWAGAGTASSPTATGNNREIRAIAGNVYISPGTKAAEAITAIQMFTSEVQDATHNGSHLSFLTTKKGVASSTGLTVNAQLNDDGTFGVARGLSVGGLTIQNAAGYTNRTLLELAGNNTFDSTNPPTAIILGQSNITSGTFAEFDYQASYNSSGSYAGVRSYGQLVGSSTNNKGTTWTFQTKGDGSGYATAVVFDQTQKATFSGVTAVKSEIRNTSLAAINATATATAAQIAGGTITSTSAAATTITFTTATLLATQLAAVQGTHFDLTIDNTAGANTVTIVLGSGMTAINSPTLTVTSGATGIATYRFTFSSTTACTVSRVQ